jgi:hypothetical protein
VHRREERATQGGEAGGPYTRGNYRRFVMLARGRSGSREAAMDVTTEEPDWLAVLLTEIAEALRRTSSTTREEEQ